MCNLFYMQNSRSILGSNVLFWNKGGCGYGTNLNNLETYTLKEAQSRHNNRDTDIPLLKYLVDKLSITAVDMQVLPLEDTPDPNDQYVIQRKGEYNGNDILFIAVVGNSYRYEDAAIFTKKEAKQFVYNLKIYAVFAKSEIDKIARRTFQIRNIDRRKMIFTPGIKLKKSKRIRPHIGKTRGNCPVCGRIAWDFNPYEAPYCNEHDNIYDRRSISM